ncbi:MAG TPA: hypothetical protein VHN14_30150 [Kofleriaceae bacterium]|nr:hypothetical protein [Kofleriaceae bacterium]
MKLDQKLGQLDQKLAKLDQKFDHQLKTALEIWGGAVLARIEASEQRLLTELARHTQANYESMASQVSIFDEKYSDLPRRVHRLEAEVFPPGRR